MVDDIVSKILLALVYLVNIGRLHGTTLFPPKMVESLSSEEQKKVE